MLTGTLLFFALGVELFEIGPQVAGFLLVLDAREDHLGTRNLGARILDVFEECRLAPDDAGFLVQMCIRDRAGGAMRAADFIALTCLVRRDDGGHLVERQRHVFHAALAGIVGDRCV